MEAVLGIGVLVVFVAIVWAYGNWLEKGMSPRFFTTALPPETVRQHFVSAVARSGWKVVDDGNPLVCQSSLLTGMRQQLSLTVGQDRGRTQVLAGPDRWISKYGIPKKAHTLRLRLNSFESHVRGQDPAITPMRTPLRGR